VHNRVAYPLRAEEYGVVSMRVKDLITSRVCGNTVFENSWIWYCDSCQQHGTAMSAKEAEYCAGAHWTWHSSFLRNEEDCPDVSDEIAWEDFYEENLLEYWEATEDERESYDGLFENDVCVIYIIDEGNNITYDIGENYEDKTPNKVTDIALMIDLQKRMGLE